MSLQNEPRAASRGEALDVKPQSPSDRHSNVAEKVQQIQRTYQLVPTPSDAISKGDDRKGVSHGAGNSRAGGRMGILLLAATIGGGVGLWNGLIAPARAKSSKAEAEEVIKKQVELAQNNAPVLGPIEVSSRGETSRISQFAWQELQNFIATFGKQTEWARTIKFAKLVKVMEPISGKVSRLTVVISLSDRPGQEGDQSKQETLVVTAGAKGANTISPDLLKILKSGKETAVFSLHRIYLRNAEQGVEKAILLFEPDRVRIEPADPTIPGYRRYQEQQQAEAQALRESAISKARTEQETVERQIQHLLHLDNLDRELDSLGSYQRLPQQVERCADEGYNLAWIEKEGARPCSDAGLGKDQWVATAFFGRMKRGEFETDVNVLRSPVWDYYLETLAMLYGYSPTRPILSPEKTPTAILKINRDLRQDELSTVSIAINRTGDPELSRIFNEYSAERKVSRLGAKYRRLRMELFCNLAERNLISVDVAQVTWFGENKTPIDRELLNKEVEKQLQLEIELIKLRDKISSKVKNQLAEQLKMRQRAHEKELNAIVEAKIEELVEDAKAFSESRKSMLTSGRAGTPSERIANAAVENALRAKLSDWVERRREWAQASGATKSTSIRPISEMPKPFEKYVDKNYIKSVLDAGQSKEHLQRRLELDGVPKEWHGTIIACLRHYERAWGYLPPPIVRLSDTTVLLITRDLNTAELDVLGSSTNSEELALPHRLIELYRAKRSQYRGESFFLRGDDYEALQIVLYQQLAKVKLIPETVARIQEY